LIGIGKGDCHGIGMPMRQQSENRVAWHLHLDRPHVPAAFDVSACIMHGHASEMPFRCKIMTLPGRRRLCLALISHSYVRSRFDPTVKLPHQPSLLRGFPPRAMMENLDLPHQVVALFKLRGFSGSSLALEHVKTRLLQLWNTSGPVKWRAALGQVLTAVARIQPC